MTWDRGGRSSEPQQHLVALTASNEMLLPSPVARCLSSWVAVLKLMSDNFWAVSSFFEVRFPLTFCNPASCRGWIWMSLCCLLCVRELLRPLSGSWIHMRGPACFMHKLSPAPKLLPPKLTNTSVSTYARLVPLSPQPAFQYDNQLLMRCIFPTSCLEELSWIFQEITSHQLHLNICVHLLALGGLYSSSKALQCKIGQRYKHFIKWFVIFFDNEAGT